VELDRRIPFSSVVITEEKAGVLQSYRLEYRNGKQWFTLFEGPAPTQDRVKFHRFDPLHAQALRITILSSAGAPAIAEFGAY
jgi:hypothetical protein